jgi:hypothetical protein
MTDEERYKEALFHVIKFMSGENEFDTLKPLNAKTTNDVIQMCKYVLQGDTTKEAIDKISSNS